MWLTVRHSIHPAYNRHRRAYWQPAGTAFPIGCDISRTFCHEGPSTSTLTVMPTPWTTIAATGETAISREPSKEPSEATIPLEVKETKAEDGPGNSRNLLCAFIMRSTCLRGGEKKEFLMAKGTCKLKKAIEPVRDKATAKVNMVVIMNPRNRAQGENTAKMQTFLCKRDK